MADHRRFVKYLMMKEPSSWTMTMRPREIEIGLAGTNTMNVLD